MVMKEKRRKEKRRVTMELRVYRNCQYPREGIVVHQIGHCRRSIAIVHRYKKKYYYSSWSSSCCPCRCYIWSAIRVGEGEGEGGEDCRWCDPLPSRTGELQGKGNWFSMRRRRRQNASRYSSLRKSLSATAALLLLLFCFTFRGERWWEMMEKAPPPPSPPTDCIDSLAPAGWALIPGQSHRASSPELK